MAVSLSRSFAELPSELDDFLAERIERNVLASLVVLGRARGDAERAPLFAWGSDDAGALRFFAMRTPPWPLLVTELAPADAEDLIERWLTEDPDVPGVTGVPAAARAV